MDKCFKWRFDDAIANEDSIVVDGTTVEFRTNDPGILSQDFDRIHGFDRRRSTDEEFYDNEGDCIEIDHADDCSFFGPVYESQLNGAQQMEECFEDRVGRDSDHAGHKPFFKTPSLTIRELEVIRESSQSSSETDITFTR